MTLNIVDFLEDGVFRITLVLPFFLFLDALDRSRPIPLISIKTAQYEAHKTKKMTRSGSKLGYNKKQSWLKTFESAHQFQPIHDEDSFLVA